MTETVITAFAEIIKVYKPSRYFIVYLILSLFLSSILWFVAIFYFAHAYFLMAGKLIIALTSFSIAVAGTIGFVFNAFTDDNTNNPNEFVARGIMLYITYQIVIMAAGYLGPKEFGMSRPTFADILLFMVIFWTGSLLSAIRHRSKLKRIEREENKAVPSNTE